MQTYRLTATSRGQVWLPVQLRRQLRIEPHTHVEISVEDGIATLKRQELQLEDVIGSIPPLPLLASDDLDELIEEAIDEAMIHKYGRR